MPAMMGTRWWDFYIRAPGAMGGGGAFDPEDPPGLTKPAKPVSSKRLKAGCNIFQHAARG